MAKISATLTPGVLTDMTKELTLAFTAPKNAPAAVIIFDSDGWTVQKPPALPIKHTAGTLITYMLGHVKGGKFQVGAMRGPEDIQWEDPKKYRSAPTDPGKIVLKLKIDGDASTYHLPLDPIALENSSGDFEVFMVVAGIAGDLPKDKLTFEPTLSPVAARRPLVPASMIVPQTTVSASIIKDLSVHEQDTLFGEQWMAKDKKKRALARVPVNGSLAQFESALNAAVAKGKGREIIVSTGHGGAAGFRGLTQTAFNTVPETGPMTGHKHSITREVLDFEKIAEKDNKGKWVGKTVPHPSGGVAVTVSQAKVDSLSPRFDFLKRAGATMRAGNVTRFIVLSCNVGKDIDFGKDLAKILGVNVQLYDDLVAMAEVEYTEPPPKPRQFQKTQVWMNSDTRPPQADPDHESFSEIPRRHRLMFKP